MILGFRVGSYLVLGSGGVIDEILLLDYAAARIASPKLHPEFPGYRDS